MMPMRTSRSVALQLIPKIHRATHQIGLHIAQWSEAGITQPEAHILDHLTTQGESTVGDLHRAFAHRRSTLTSVLDRLADRKLISRDASAADRRTFVITLTAAGKAVAARLHRELQALESTVLTSVSQRDIKGFENVLDAIGRALHQYRETPD
jgi:DNA-binding MarR family transcriptional regulator